MELRHLDFDASKYIEYWNYVCSSCQKIYPEDIINHVHTFIQNGSVELNFKWVFARNLLILDHMRSERLDKEFFLKVFAHSYFSNSGGPTAL